MSQSAKAQEPSMEEILASIRRIIADDDGTKPAPKPVAAAPAPPPRPAPAPPPPPPRVAAPPPAPPAPMPPPVAAAPPPAETQDDILELTESMAEPASDAGSFQTIDGEPDVVFADAPPSPEPPRQSDDPPRPAPPQPSAFDRSLISSSTSAAVDSAFNSLAHTVLVQNARTLEDLVREMLRPMLKSWLDDNLPSIVERIVRAEIERVSRGRG